MVRSVTQKDVEEFCFDHDVFYKNGEPGPRPNDDEHMGPGPGAEMRMEAIEVLTEELELYEKNPTIQTYARIEKWALKYTSNAVTAEEIVDEFGLQKQNIIDVEAKDIEPFEIPEGNLEDILGPVETASDLRRVKKGLKGKSEVLKSASQIGKVSEIATELMMTTSGSSLEVQIIAGTAIIAGGIVVSTALLAKGIVKGVGKGAIKLGKKAFKHLTAPKGTAERVKRSSDKKKEKYKGKDRTDAQKNRAKRNAKNDMKLAIEGKTITSKLVQVLQEKVDGYDGIEYEGLDAEPELGESLEAVRSGDVFVIDDVHENLEKRESTEYKQIQRILDEMYLASIPEEEENVSRRDELRLSRLEKETVLEIAKSIRIVDGKIVASVDDPEMISEETAMALELLDGAPAPESTENFEELVDSHRLVSEVLTEVADRNKLLVAQELDHQMEVIIDEIQLINSEEETTKDDEKKRAALRKLAQKKVASLERAGIVETLERGRRRDQRVAKDAESILLSDLDKAKSKGTRTIDRLEEEHEDTRDDS